MNDNLLFAFILTLFAGLSTGIGSAFAIFTKKTNRTFLSFSLGFSAGVMIYVSFVEIFQKARVSLINVFGSQYGEVYTVLAFFGGILIILIIDALIPSPENPHEIHFVEEISQEELKNKKTSKNGISDCNSNCNS